MIRGLKKIFLPGEDASLSFATLLENENSKLRKIYESTADYFQREVTDKSNAYKQNQSVQKINPYALMLEHYFSIGEKLRLIQESIDKAKANGNLNQNIIHNLIFDLKSIASQIYYLGTPEYETAWRLSVFLQFAQKEIESGRNPAYKDFSDIIEKRIKNLIERPSGFKKHHELLMELADLIASTQALDNNTRAILLDILHAARKILHIPRDVTDLIALELISLFRDELIDYRVKPHEQRAVKLKQLIGADRDSKIRHFINPALERLYQLQHDIRYTIRTGQSLLNKNNEYPTEIISVSNIPQLIHLARIRLPLDSGLPDRLQKIYISSLSQPAQMEEDWVNVISVSPVPKNSNRGLNSPLWLFSIQDFSSESRSATIDKLVNTYGGSFDIETIEKLKLDILAVVPTGMVFILKSISHGGNVTIEQIINAFFESKPSEQQKTLLNTFSFRVKKISPELKTNLEAIRLRALVRQFDILIDEALALHDRYPKEKEIGDCLFNILSAMVPFSQWGFSLSSEGDDSVFDVIASLIISGDVDCSKIDALLLRLESSEPEILPTSKELEALTLQLDALNQQFNRGFDMPTQRL